MQWRFSPPIRRVQYLRRQDGGQWVRNLSENLSIAYERQDYVAVSTALNNAALFFFKSGMTSISGDLCRLQYMHFTQLRIPELQLLALQPWINEGRLLIYQKNYAEARLRISYGTAPATVCIGNTTIELDPEGASVCRAVAAIDGFRLELGAAGVAAADTYLSRLLSDGGPTSNLMELKTQSSLACGQIEQCKLALDLLMKLDSYLPAVLTYNAAISSRVGDATYFAKNILVLASLVGDWAVEPDDLVSVIHALVWIRSITGGLIDKTISAKTWAYILSAADRLEDQELVCLIRKERYDPAPSGSRVRAEAEQLFKLCCSTLDALRRTCNSC